MTARARVRCGMAGGARACSDPGRAAAHASGTGAAPSAVRTLAYPSLPSARSASERRPARARPSAQARRLAAAGVGPAPHHRVPHIPIQRPHAQPAATTMRGSTEPPSGTRIGPMGSAQCFTKANHANRARRHRDWPTSAQDWRASACANALAGGRTGPRCADDRRVRRRVEDAVAHAPCEADEYARSAGGLWVRHLPAHRPCAAVARTVRRFRARRCAHCPSVRSIG